MKPIRVLILANSNRLLCTSVAKLISHDKLITKVDVCGPNQQVEGSNYALAIVFAIYPISKLELRLDRLGSNRPKILLVLGTDDTSLTHHIRYLDVEGVISIDASSDELLLAIDTLIKQNLRYLSPHLVKPVARESSISDPLANLSQKEMDVALSLMKGKRNVEIAKELNISQKTVNTYKSRLYKKLDIDSDILFLRHMLLRGSFFDDGFISIS